jgi:coatomer subunit beta
MSQIKSGKVFRGALWIVGEYSDTVAGMSIGVCHQSSAGSHCFVCPTSDIDAIFQELRKAIGEIPILASEQVIIAYTIPRLTLRAHSTFTAASA